MALGRYGHRLAVCLLGATEDLSVDEDCLKLVLSMGADPNARDSEGKTPLMYTVQDGNARCTALLLRHPNIDVNKACPGGETPIFLAVENGNVDIVALLIKASEVDVNRSIVQGDITPLHIGVSSNRPRCVALLLTHPRIRYVNTFFFFLKRTLYTAASSKYTRVTIVVPLVPHTRACSSLM